MISLISISHCLKKKKSNIALIKGLLAEVCFWASGAEETQNWKSTHLPTSGESLISIL